MGQKAVECCVQESTGELRIAVENGKPCTHLGETKAQTVHDDFLGSTAVIMVKDVCCC